MNLFLTNPEIPANPTLNYVLVAIGTIVITKIFEFGIKKLENSKDIKIAEMNSDKQTILDLKNQLDLALENLRNVEEELKSSKLSLAKKEKIIEGYKNVLLNFKVLFNILNKQMSTKLDKDTIIILEEVQKIFDKNLY